MIVKDKDHDTLEIEHSFADESRLKLTASQRGGSTEGHTCLIFNQQEAEQIRDKLIAMYPLPVQSADVIHLDQPEPALTSVGEVAAFAPALPGITINIAHLTVNA